MGWLSISKNFNDANLEVSFTTYYDKTKDEEYKKLYRMYNERIRPKIIIDRKDLYEESPNTVFSVLKWESKRNPDKITEIVGSVE